MMATCYAAYASPLPVLYRPCFYSAFQEPVSYAEAMRRTDATKWQVAMEEEKAAFFANGIWRIVPINHSWNLLSSKWVFKIKSDEYGHITRYRARLVAKLPPARKHGLRRYLLSRCAVQHPSDPVSLGCALRPVQAAPGLSQGVHAGGPGHPLLHKPTVCDVLAYP
jgi:hypothetical protein